MCVCDVFQNKYSKTVSFVYPNTSLSVAACDHGPPVTACTFNVSSCYFPSHVVVLQYESETNELLITCVCLTGHGGNGFLKFQDSEEISNVELADAFEQMWQKRR